MLAKFENGYFLEVGVRKDMNGIAEYVYDVYDEEFCPEGGGWTEYRSIQ